MHRASAHPGVGLVRAPDGSVYFTDLVHVWRIAPDGVKTVAVRDVHTHELAVDRAGNLYGEDNRYSGNDAGDGTYRHRIWRRSPDGRLTDIVPWRPGFWRDYGFTRDVSGTMYWTQCPEQRCTIYRAEAGSAAPARSGAPRTTAARRVVAPPGRFANPVQWLAASATEAAVLYVVDGPALRRLDAAGRVTTVNDSVGTQLMGMWASPDGRDLYVAAYGERTVVRVGLRDGRAATVVRSPAPWGPSSALVAPDGAMWILEYSTANNAARVRRIAANGAVRVY